MMPCHVVLLRKGCLRNSADVAKLASENANKQIVHAKKVSEKAALKAENQQKEGHGGRCVAIIVWGGSF